MCLPVRARMCVCVCVCVCLSQIYRTTTSNFNYKIDFIDIIIDNKPTPYNKKGVTAKTALWLDMHVRTHVHIHTCASEPHSTTVYIVQACLDLCVCVCMCPCSCVPP